jgi:hypothetical protein
MKKGGNTGLFVGLGVAAAAAALYFKQQGGQLTSNLSFGIKSVSFDKATTEKNLYLRIFLKLNSTLTNTSKLAGRIDSGELALFFKDKQLTTARLTKPLIVEGNKTMELPILLSFQTLSIFSTVTAAAQYFLKNQKIGLTVRGVLNTSAGVVNINENITL